MKRLKHIVLFITILILIIFIYTNFINSKNKNENKEIAVTGEITLMTNTIEHKLCIDDCMVEASGTILKASNIDGTNKWSHTMPSKITKIEKAATNILVLDDKNNVLYYTKKGEKLWQLNIKGEIEDIFIDDRGNVLLEIIINNKRYAEVYNVKGVKTGALPIEEAYLLSFSSLSDTVHSIGVLHIEKDTLSSKLITFNRKGEIIWAKSYEGHIIPYISYISGKLICTDNQNITSYKSNGDKTEGAKIEGQVLKVEQNGNTIAIFNKNNSGYSLVTLGTNLEKKGEKKIDIKNPDIAVGKNYIALYTSDKIYIYDHKCNNVANYDKISNIMNLYFDDKSVLYIETNKSLYRLEI